MLDSGNARANQLLAGLSADALNRLLPHLQPVDLRLGEVVYEPGDTLSHAYFPTSSLVSLLHVMENGASAEIAIVGNDGIVGVSLFMGGASTSTRGVVQGAGRAL